MASLMLPMWGGLWRVVRPFEHRAFVVGGDWDRLLAGLDELAANELGSVIRGTSTPGARPYSSSPAKELNDSAWEWDCTPDTRCSLKRLTPWWTN